MCCIYTKSRLHGCKLGRYVEINERVVLHNVTVGDFSYFERNSKAIYSDIGRFLFYRTSCMCECARASHGMTFNA